MQGRNRRDGWISAAVTVVVGYAIVIVVEQTGRNVPFWQVLLLFLTLYIGTFAVITAIRSRRQ